METQAGHHLSLKERYLLARLLDEEIANLTRGAGYQHVINEEWAKSAHRLGEIWALEWDGASATNYFLVDAPFAVSTFGVGEDGELYVANYGGGRGIYRLVETPIVTGP